MALIPRHSPPIRDQDYFHPRDLTGAATLHTLSHTVSMGRESMGRDAKKTELVPGTLEMLILKTLERNTKPMHGYGIAHYINGISNDVLRVEEGSLYPALQRMAHKAWVKSEWGPSENNRRARHYKLTPAGQKQLKREVADFERVLEAILRVVQPA